MISSISLQMFSLGVFKADFLPIHEPSMGSCRLRSVTEPRTAIDSLLFCLAKVVVDVVTDMLNLIMMVYNAPKQALLAQRACLTPAGSRPVESEPFGAGDVGYRCKCSKSAAFFQSRKLPHTQAT